MSCKVLAVITAIGIGGALIFALQDRPARDRPGELFTTENRPTADELRRMAEEEAARTSEVFFATQSPTAPSGFAAPSLAAPGRFPDPQTGQVGPQSDQDRQLAFLNAAVNRRIFEPDRVTQPASPYVLQAGSVIPAALVTGIRSDLPGQIVAQVTQNVYDSPLSWKDSPERIAQAMQALRTASITIGAVYSGPQRSRPCSTSVPNWGPTMTIPSPVPSATAHKTPSVTQAARSCVVRLIFRQP